MEKLLFTAEHKKPLGNFRRNFQRALKRAGIENLRFHDLRHTAVTNMRKGGVDASVIMAITGHKTIAMFKRYNRLDLEDSQEVIKKLNVYLSGIKREGMEDCFHFTSNPTAGNTCLNP